MARHTKALTVKELEAKANTIGDHTAGGVDGTLLLRVRKTSAGNLSRSWKFVTRKNGKLKTFGLGTYTAQMRDGALTLAQARAEARRILDAIRNGRNPREEVQPDADEEAPKVIEDDCPQELNEETKALYEIANAIDRLALIMGHSAMLSNEYKTLERRGANVRWFTGDFVDSSLCAAMCDAENAINRRHSDGKVDGGHVADEIL